MMHYNLGVVPSWQWDIEKKEKKGDYRVTIKCPNCDGAGSYAMTADPYSVEHECCACAGIGRTSFVELSELYEDTAALLEDYPDALKIERIA